MCPKGRNASRDGLVKLWKEAFIICNTITLWNNHVIRVNTHIKRVDYLYNSINQCMIRLWWSRTMFIEIWILNRSRLLLTLQVVHFTFDMDGIPVPSDSMRRARDVCEGICNRKIPFSYYCKHGVLFFGTDGTGPADVSKMITCQGMVSSNYGRGLLLFAILREIITSFMWTCIQSA